MKRAFEVLGFLLFVAAGVGAAYNVMSDIHDVEEMAKGVACSAEVAACKPQTTRIERNPIAQSFSIVTAKRSVDIRCTRAFYLAGPYTCTLQ